MSHALTPTDAFFVAYQEQRGILMHFGVELAITGVLTRATIERALAQVRARWPAIACTLERGVVGLRWRATAAAAPLLHVSTELADVARWRGAPIDPFREPPFGVRWIPAVDGRPHVLAVRCHHAVADGELFFTMVHELVGALARATPAPVLAPIRTPHPLAPRALWRATRLVPSLREVRRLAREATDGRAARIPLRALAPGAVASCERRIARATVETRARAEQVRAPWIVAAAWLQAACPPGSTRASLEVPVNLRRGAEGMTGTGNHLAVLTLFGDPRRSLGELARDLWRAYAAGIRARAHLAVPLLATVSRLVPYALFRRIAVTPTSTGFATSHFTWLARSHDLRAQLRAWSGDQLALVDHQIYTPVCLAMGAALAVVAWPDELQLALTHRLTGLTPVDAARLADRLVAILAS